MPYDEQITIGPAGILISGLNYAVNTSPNNESLIVYGDNNGTIMGHFLIGDGPKINVKTLFGNQSIYGSGNIDLYRHNVKLTAVANSQTICDCVFTVISSSNTVIDSLTDLFSVLKPIVGSNSTYPVNGRIYYTSNNKYYVATRVYPTSDGGIIANTPEEERWFKWPELSTLTFYDSVTTV